MQKSKSAFTMIELIFVIVILGIMAAIAVPKLAATRADAEASARAQMIMTGATEIASYAVAVGRTESNLSEMSNSISALEISGDAVLSDYNATISTGAVLDCVTVGIFIGAMDDTLIITFGNANSDTACTSLQSLINTDEYPIKLRGVSVVY